MKHIKTVNISAEELARVRRLLEIPSLSELTDRQLMEIGANTHHNEGVLFVQFDDGSTLNYDLCSGSENYYDDVVWTNKNGNIDVCLECTFDLDDIEFDVFGETYIVKLNVV